MKGSYYLQIYTSTACCRIANGPCPRCLPRGLSLAAGNFSGSSVVVQICNALLTGVLPPATQDPSLNYIYVKRISDASGVQQVR